MVQGYYTLQEAAQVLGMPPDELKLMAQKNQIRSFQDRGTWRFRVQDIQELARQRGAASDLDLILGEAPPVGAAGPVSPAPKGGPKSGIQKGGAVPSHLGRSDAPEVFDFDLALPEDTVGIGHEILGGGPSSSKKSKPASDKKRTPPPAPVPTGSDSDVKLVTEGSDSSLPLPPSSIPKVPSSDSDVKLVGADSDVKMVPESGIDAGKAKAAGKKKSVLAGPPSSAPKRPSKLAPPAPDSGVRLVPMDSDSDIRIVTPGSDEMAVGGEEPPKSATDSDVRLEKISPASQSGEGQLTEEINLDEELRKQEEKSRQKPQAKVKPKSRLPQFPTTSPFELSESDLEIPTPPAPAAQAPAETPEDSSDFELTPVGHTLLGPPTGEDFSLELPDDSDLSLAAGGAAAKAEEADESSSSDLNLSLEPMAASDESSFELSLDSDIGAAAAQASDSDSEFELSLDVDDSGQAALSSDSEFELTLDDSGGLAPLEEEAPPQVKAGADKDIFETDFEVPALEDESGSEVAALDTDLESSDFDLALDSDIAVEDESGSQVVALDEDEADAGAATVAALDQDLIEVDEEAPDFDVGAEEEGIAVAEEGEYAEGPTREVIVEKLLKPAPWGALPVFVMLPCVIVMVLVGVMGFELVQSASGYKPPGLLTKAIGDLIGQKIK